MTVIWVCVGRMISRPENPSTNITKRGSVTKYAIPDLQPGQDGVVFTVADGRTGMVINPTCTPEEATKLFATLFAEQVQKAGITQ